MAINVCDCVWRCVEFVCADVMVCVCVRVCVCVCVLVQSSSITLAVHASSPTYVGNGGESNRVEADYVSSCR